MSDTDISQEVLIVSDSGTRDTNCTMFYLGNRQLLEIYKEGHSKRNALDLIGTDYLISAFEDKPKIKIWRIGHSTKDYLRITTPGFVTALAVSKDGKYCVAGIGSTVYIWEVASGNLNAQLQYHVGDITCVKFTSDGFYFITGGTDGMVIVFSLSEAIKQRISPNEVPKPEYTWTDHGKEVTDIYVGVMGTYSRIATTSRDKTCRIYELDYGHLLCTIHMNAAVTAVTMDLCECFLFLGTDIGNIYKINLFNMTNASLHFEDVAQQNVYAGHTKEITSLCFSDPRNYLVSGSRDKHCIIWDIINFSRVHTLDLAGPVTNVITCRLPPSIIDKDYVPQLCIESFKRENSLNDDDALIYLKNQNLSTFHAGSADQYFDPEVLKCASSKLPKIKASCSVNELSSVNQAIFSFAVTEAFKHLAAEDNMDTEDN